MPSIFVIISSIIALISPLVYASAILKGNAKPHRTTRLVLLVITTISTLALLAAGNRVAVWLAGVSMIQSVLIFALSIKFGMGGWSRIDILCLLIAITGIILWRTTNNPRLALYFSIAADFTGVIPTIIKTYRLPKTEVWSFFLLDVFAAIFSLLAIRSWVLEDYAFPLYILLVNSLMVMLIITPRPPQK
ncbi:hypothetical protein HYS00_03190 [Candidatus Microgenomates bacterium]|nr:hypothetical protein [Candidatus Microgenomates bacterium]